MTFRRVEAEFVPQTLRDNCDPVEHPALQAEHCIIESTTRLATPVRSGSNIYNDALTFSSVPQKRTAEEVDTEHDVIPASADLLHRVTNESTKALWFATIPRNIEDADPLDGDLSAPVIPADHCDFPRISEVLAILVRIGQVSELMLVND